MLLAGKGRTRVIHGPWLPVLERLQPCKNSYKLPEFLLRCVMTV